MQLVSPALREAFNPNAGQGGRYIDYTITWGVINDEAQAEASATAAQEPPLSRLHQLFNLNLHPLPFASFETGGMPLDGNTVVPPRVDELPEAEMGLVMPELCDSDGYYAIPQQITVTLPYKFAWLALTFHFGAVPAANFSVEYYSDQNLLHHGSVLGNTAGQFVYSQAVEGCNRVELSITRCALPHHRVRLAELTFGVMERYTKDDTLGLQITEQIDLLGERAPANELKLTVANPARKYNLFDISGLARYLQTRQRIVAQIGAQLEDGSIEYVDMGKYYLEQPELKKSFTQLELKATNLLGVLQDTLYTTGVYKTATLAEFLQDVAADAGVQVAYPEDFAELELAAYIPTLSHAEAFRQIAQAGCTLLHCTRGDVVTFSRPALEPMLTIGPEDYALGNGLQPSDDKILNTVELAAVTLTPEEEASELAEATGSGYIAITYDPSVGHTAQVEDGELLSATYYCDNALLEITGGTVKVLGHKLASSTQTISATTAQPNEQRLVYSVGGSPLIQPANAGQVAGYYLQAKASKRRMVKVQYRGYPYIEMTDCVNFHAQEYLTQPFFVHKNDIKLAGGMTATLEAREGFLLEPAMA